MSMLDVAIYYFAHTPHAPLLLPPLPDNTYVSPCAMPRAYAAMMRAADTADGAHATCE